MHGILILGLFFSLVVFGENIPKFPNPKNRFSLENIDGAYHLRSGSLSRKLFGPARDIVMRLHENEAYEHPRIVMGKREWESLLKRYSNGNYKNRETWVSSFFKLSKDNGPFSKHVSFFASLEASGETNLYQGMHKSDFRSERKYEKYRTSLKPLGQYIRKANELNSHSLFLCSFWARVSEKQKFKPLLQKNAVKLCINATVAWATVLLSHRTYYCTPLCKRRGVDEYRSYIWNFDMFWQVKNDWHSGGLGLALAYDFLYDLFSNSQKRTIRSAIALLVMRRFTWGATANSTVRSPNARIHPHRIFSNWALYHSNIYLTNLAIEHEEDFDSYARNTLLENDSGGFNVELDKNWDAIFRAFMTHSIYPDGSSFEDGYTYHTAFREGSLGLIANHRRGKANHINTERFRNMIHSIAQSWEPWQCGDLVGHASGGGLHYPSYVGLLLYSYPYGVLPKMLWAQRFGKEFKNTPTCRIWWTQTMTQLAFFGSEHKKISGSIIDSPSKLPDRYKSLFPLSYVTTRRGLIICRSSHSSKASYLHFDARIDSIFLGHDNADRGSITFSALEQKWIVDLPWKKNVDSRKHSLLHIDGLSQAVKAPPATILKVNDDKSIFVAAMDLTYTYNVQWAPAWQGPNIGTGNVKEYSSNISWIIKTYKFKDRENNSPWDLGWPVEDDAKDLGFAHGMNLNPVPNIGFAGINQWRRPYRQSYLKYYVRSVLLIRPKKDNVGYAVIADSVNAGPGLHEFESYLILHDKVSVSNESFCGNRKCLIRLQSQKKIYLDICVVASGFLSFRREVFGSNSQRLVFKSTKLVKENIWIILFPHYGVINYFLQGTMKEMKIQYKGSQQYFYFEGRNHTVISENNTTRKFQGNNRCKRNFLDEKGYDNSPLRNLNPKYNNLSHCLSCFKKSSTFGTGIQPKSSRSQQEYKDKHPSLSQSNYLRPMKPQRIQENRKIEKTYLELTSIPRTSYFLYDNKDYQVVFVFNSLGQNCISTCSNFTNSESRISIYDCSNIDQYYARRCNRVFQSSKNDICHDMKPDYLTKVKIQLEDKKDYYIVVHLIHRVSLQPKLSLLLSK